MNIVYNTQNEIASSITDFLFKSNPNIRKTQTNIIPFIVIGMILSESTVSTDIAKNLKGHFSLVQLDSVIKRIKRLFSNKLFDPYLFFDNIIRNVISNYKVKHSDKRVHIIFDHMFSHDNYTVFMISLRIGKQGIPLWFRCFEGNKNLSAFKTSLFKKGIAYVSSLFPSDYDLIFLADRWFNSTPLLNFINSLGHTYCVRLKSSLRCFYFDNKLNNYYWKSIKDLPSLYNSPSYFPNVFLSNKHLITNITISKKKRCF